MSKRKTYLLSDPFPMEEIILGETKKAVLDLIYKGGNPHSISKELKISRPTTIQHLQELRSKGLTIKGMKNEGSYGYPYLISEKGKHLIEKCVGFPVKISRVAKDNPKKTYTLKPDSVRGHAFMFVLKIPKILNWEKREEKLKDLKISYKKLNLFGGGQGIEFKGRKIHLTSSSIIVYERESYISDLARQSKSQAVNKFLRLIKQLERKLKEDFSDHGRYKFKVTRQHYALIKNALARQYNQEGKKLEVYNHAGLWFLIDNSFNLNEAETVHPKTAVKDNENVQNFFNSLKEYPITSKEILNNSKELRSMVKEISKDQIQLGQVLDQVNKNLIKISSVVLKDKK